jgi:3-polyprenyl-4-hydroxybenzoate decarboxylase
MLAMLSIAGPEFRSLVNQMHATILSITYRDRLFTLFYVPSPHCSHKLLLLVFHPITPAVCVVHYPPMSTGREVLVSRIQRRHIVRAIRANLTYIGLALLFWFKFVVVIDHSRKITNLH